MNNIKRIKRLFEILQLREDLRYQLNGGMFFCENRQEYEMMKTKQKTNIRKMIKLWEQILIINSKNFETFYKMDKNAYDKEGFKDLTLKNMTYIIEQINALKSLL